MLLPPLWPQTEITDESAAIGHQEGQEAKHLLSPSPTLKTSMNTQGQIAGPALRVPYLLDFQMLRFSPRSNHFLPTRLEVLVGGRGKG